MSDSPAFPQRIFVAREEVPPDEYLTTAENLADLATARPRPVAVYELKETLEVQVRQQIITKRPHAKKAPNKPVRRKK